MRLWLLRYCIVNKNIVDTFSYDLLVLPQKDLPAGPPYDIFIGINNVINKGYLPYTGNESNKVTNGGISFPKVH